MFDLVHEEWFLVSGMTNHIFFGEKLAQATSPLALFTLLLCKVQEWRHQCVLGQGQSSALGWEQLLGSLHVRALKCCKRQIDEAQTPH